MLDTVLIRTHFYDETLCPSNAKTLSRSHWDILVGIHGSLGHHFALEQVNNVEVIQMFAWHGD